jgi:hypothetical protein
MSPIERATLAVCNDIRQAVFLEHAAHNLTITGASFARIVALYLSDKSTDDWLEMLGASEPRTGNNFR